MARTTLEEFAAAQPNYNAKCRICALPAEVLAQVRAARGKVPGTVIARWLREEHGLDIHTSGDAVRNCNRHHT